MDGFQALYPKSCCIRFFYYIGGIRLEIDETGHRQCGTEVLTETCMGLRRRRNLCFSIDMCTLRTILVFSVMSNWLEHAIQIRDSRHSLSPPLAQPHVSSMFFRSLLHNRRVNEWSGKTFRHLAAVLSKNAFRKEQFPKLIFFFF